MIVIVNKIKAATIEQQNILCELRKLSYEEISKYTDVDLEKYIKADLKTVIRISKNVEANKEISVVVVVDGGTDVDYVSIFPEVNTGDSYFESTSFTDGFDIFPDGKIRVMHPEEYDDD